MKPSQLIPLVALTAGCHGSDAAGGPERASRFVDARVDTVVSVESGAIGQVSDIAVARDGRVYLSDAQAHVVHVLDTDGRLAGAIGREGSGPAEFQRPGRIFVELDTLVVVDVGNTRVQVMDLSGLPISTRPLPPGAPPSIGPDGRIVQPVFGRDSVLAVMYSRDLEPIAKLGTSVGEMVNVVRLGEMKEAIGRGEVPTIFLNSAEAVIAADGATWLAAPSRASVSRYDALGNEEWATTVQDSAFEAVRVDFMERNATIGRNRIWPLRYLLDLRVVGEDAWVLLGQSIVGPAVIAVLGPDGREQSRIVFPSIAGAVRFAVDEEREFAYFVVAESAGVVRTTYRVAG